MCALNPYLPQGLKGQVTRNLERNVKLFGTICHAKKNEGIAYLRNRPGERLFKKTFPK
jgi:hypothetical protein